jgi:hypothetical protein
MRTFDLFPPYGFRWTNPPLTISRTGNTITHNFNIRSLIPAITKTYYVDPVNGNDGNAGTSSGAALKKLATALAKTDVDQIILVLSADYIARTTDGWNNTQPTRSLSVINDTGFHFICPTVASSVAPTWVAHGTMANCYKTTTTSANASNVTDFKPSSDESLSYTDRYGVTGIPSNMSSMRAFNTLTLVATEAAVGTTPGSWFHNGTDLVVRAIDSRNLIGDSYMQPTNNSNSGRMPSIANATIYVRGIDFVGGRPFYSFVASATTGTKLVFERCSFQGANVVSGHNGLNVQAFQNVYLQDCLEWKNGADGFNYHSNEADGTTANTSPSVIEIGCMGGWSGTTGSAGVSDNTTTSHDFANVIRINGIYLGSSDRVLADTNSAHSWNLGCHIGQAKTIAAGKESVASIGTASKVWLDSCYTESGSNAQWIATSGALLKHYNSGAVVNAGTGEATGAVEPFVWQLVGTGTATGTTAANYNVTLPTLLAGDVVLVAYGISNAADATLVVNTSGYTQPVELYIDDDHDVNLAVAYKVMTSTPDTVVNVMGPSSVSRGGVAVAFCFRWLSESFIDATPTTASAANSITPDPPAITAISPSAVIMAIGAASCTLADSVGTAPTGYTDLTAGSIAGTIDSLMIAVALKPLTGGGTEDPGTFTNYALGTAANGSWAAATFALAALPTGGGGNAMLLGVG